MVGGLMQLVQDAHVAVSQSRRREYRIAEVVLGHHLRAGECEQYATRLNLLECLHVKTGISLQRIVQCTTVLGERRRVEDNQVVVATGTLQILERILAISLVTLVTGEVQLHVLCGQLNSLGTAIHRVDKLRPTPHGVEREATGIAEHIKHLLAIRELFEQRAVVPLVNEEARLLSTKPIDVELQSVLHRNVVLAAANDETVLLSEVSLEWQRGLALVIHVLHPLAHHAEQLLGYALTLHVYAHTMSLHDSRLAINVDNQSRHVVALAMHEAVGVVHRVVDDADGAAHVESRLQLALPEGVVDFLVVE